MRKLLEDLKRAQYKHIFLPLFGDASSRLLNIESNKPRDQADLNIVNKDALMPSTSPQGRSMALLAKSQLTAPGCFGCCALLPVCSGSALEVELTWNSRKI